MRLTAGAFLYADHLWNYRQPNDKSPGWQVIHQSQLDRKPPIGERYTAPLRTET